MDNKMNIENIVYKDKFYPVIELFDFVTTEGYHVDHGLFISEDFIDADDHSLDYKTIDYSIYAYLPREFMEKCTEKELRKYIKKNIG